MISVGELCMLKDDPKRMDSSFLCPTPLPNSFFYYLYFREAVIRLLTLGLVRGKSGHQRAGFPVKAGGLFQDKFTASATENKPPPFGARVKRWGKSPPLFKQLNGHGKPNPMQDEIGNRVARLWFRYARTLLRQGFNLCGLDR